jgi:hypothetical protein
MRGTLIPWHLHCLLVEHAQFLEEPLVLRKDLGPLPSGDLFFLHALAGARGAVLAELGPWRHGGCAVEQREEAEDERRWCLRWKKNRGKRE